VSGLALTHGGEGVNARPDTTIGLRLATLTAVAAVVDRASRVPGRGPGQDTGAEDRSAQAGRAYQSVVVRDEGQGHARV